MSDDGYRPTGPLDPVAAQIAGYFGQDPSWTGKSERPAAETRAAFRAATPVSGEPAMEHVEDFAVPVAGGDIAVRLYRPGGTPRALVVWAHGGGYLLGSLDELDNFSRMLAKGTGCAVVSVEYRLAPEHKFPTALNDMIAAVRWTADRIAELAGAAVPLVVGGDSAGANLATVATRKLRGAGGPAIAANILAYPSTDSPDAESLHRFDGPFLTAGDVAWFFSQYLPDAASGTDPDFAPIRALDLGVLPPTLLITAEHDIITEQAEAYGRKLADAGVEVKTIRYPGMIHGFMTLDFFMAGAAGEAIRETAEFIAAKT